ncbi:hypothetical protein ACMDCR_29960 [Labrys okinawensis]|uniref:hypothetical protein n=1 Tax=Labrys okinawensis TaxID=346911 RepID=UPI0039BC9AE6
MIQFQKFPIYILYSLHRQQAVDPLWRQYFSEMKTAQKNAQDQLQKHHLEAMKRFQQIAQEKDDLISAVMQWQLMEDLDPKYRKEIHEYESTVEHILRIISRTSIGNKLLGMLKPDQKIFIIPATWNEPTAQTLLKTEAEGGGIRIYFNPAAFRHIFVSGRPPADETEDTLFHELVHAMRLSQNRKSERALLNADFNKSLEEFVATQFENIFHAARRRSDVYSTYLGGYRNKEDMYKYLIEDAELVMALKFILQYEPLAAAAAVLQQPEYNPFRDLKEIEQKSLRHFKLDKFMDF